MEEPCKENTLQFLIQLAEESMPWDAGHREDTPHSCVYRPGDLGLRLRLPDAAGAITWIWSLCFGAQSPALKLNSGILGLGENVIQRFLHWDSVNVCAGEGCCRGGKSLKGWGPSFKQSSHLFPIRLHCMNLPLWLLRSRTPRISRGSVFYIGVSCIV